jgi:hypothetical protein
MERCTFTLQWPWDLLSCNFKEKMDVACFSGMSVKIYKTTRPHIPEDNILHNLNDVVCGERVITETAVAYFKHRNNTTSTETRL